MAEKADNRGTAGKSAAGMNVDTKLVRQLAELLAETGLTEIEVEEEGRRIRVARQAAPAPAAHVVAAPAHAAPADGTVTQILIENAQPVEYDQPLVVVG